MAKGSSASAKDKPTTLPFVGREETLDQLQRAYQEAQQGRSQVLLLEGEPGIGKTRLAEEFLAAATAGDPQAKVLRGRGFDLNHTGDAYGVLLQILEALKGRQDRSSKRRSKFISNVLPAWLGVVPIVGGFAAAGATTLASLLDLRDLDEISNQTHLFQRVAQILAKEAEKYPVVIFIDDLQWADNASLSALNFLASNLRDKRVFIVGTLRTQETTPAESVLPQVIAELESRHLGHVIELQRLSFDEARSLTQDLIPNEFPDRFYEQLYERSGGNPFFVRELVNLLILRGEVTQGRGGRWRLVKPLDEQSIPETVEVLLEQRINLLSRDLRALCELAAVEGTRFTLEVILGILEAEQQLSKTRALQELSEIEKRYRLVNQDGRRAHLEFYKFVHGLIREVLYQSINEPLRKHYHALIARRLEPFATADEFLSFEIAQHFQDAANPLAAAPYWIRAGKEQLKTYAVADSAQSFHSAVECIDNGLAADAAVDQSSVDGLLTLKAEALMAAAEAYGIQARTPAALHDAQDALVIWRHLDRKPEQAQALHRIGLCHSEHRDFADCLASLNEGLSIAKELGDEPMQGRFLRDIGNAYIYMEQFDNAHAALTPAVALFERLNDERESIATMLVLGYCYYAEGNNAASLDAYARALATAERIKDDYRINQILQIQALALMRAGHVPEALAAGYRAVALAERYAIEEFKSNRILGDLLYENGDTVEAGRSYGRALHAAFDAHENVRQDFMQQLTDKITLLSAVDAALALSWCSGFEDVSEARSPGGAETLYWRDLAQSIGKGASGT